MAINNFKRLDEGPEGGAPQAPPQIERGLKSNLGIFSMVGNVIELYLPRIFDMFVSMSKGGRDEILSQDEEIDSSFGPGGAPGVPDSDDENG